MKYNENLKLCYVEGNFAWFTTAPLSEQWGDDWDDAPYEHNAGYPYEMEGEELVKVAFEGNLRTPREGYSNSPYSVEYINNGEVPWLTSSPGFTFRVNIMAGTSLERFAELVKDLGGEVYFPNKTNI